MSPLTGAGTSYAAIINGLILARKTSDMTQQDIADAIGVSVQTVSAWETYVNNPPLDRVCQWASVVGLDWANLAWPKR